MQSKEFDSLSLEDKAVGTSNKEVQPYSYRSSFDRILHILRPSLVPLNRSIVERLRAISLLRREPPSGHGRSTSIYNSTQRTSY